MLSLLGLAHAHDAALPHLHTTDPAAAAVVGFWVLAALAFGVVSRRMMSAAG